MDPGESDRPARVDEQALSAWIAGLLPPPGTMPTVGHWPSLSEGRHDWFELGERMVATRGLPMLRHVGEHSCSLKHGRQLGAPPGSNPDVDDAWSALGADTQWVDHFVERILAYDMANATEERRSGAEAELRALFDARTGFAHLRRFAREFGVLDKDSGTWRPPAWPKPIM